MQSGQKPAMMLLTKKGSQQMMKTPMTVPRVLAALASLLNRDAFFFRLQSKIRSGKFSVVAKIKICVNELFTNHGFHEKPVQKQV